METHTKALNFKKEKEKIPILIGSSNETESFFKSPYWQLSYHFPWNPDPLCPGNSYVIYDEMHNDDQVKSALAIKKDMAVNTGWMIQGENQKINDFITKIFEDINSASDYNYSFDDILRDMLSSYGYGFSLSEPVHTIKDGKLIYKSIRTRPPHSFKFNVDDFGTIESISQITNKGEIIFKPEVFLHHIYQMEFGNPYGKSDLSSSFNAWKAKKFFTRFFAIYVEKYASPPLVGKFPKTYTASEIKDFHDTIKSSQNASTFAIPDDVMIEFVQTSRDASDVYLKGLDYYNMQIARSILVPDLLGLGGTETKGGSYALGREQFKVFLSTIKKDRESLERKITMKLVRPLVLANFGDIPCWFEFKPYTFDDVKEYLNLWIQAVTGKVFKANEEEINYFRQATGFPEGEVNIPEPPPAPTFGGNPNENGQFPRQSNDDKKTKQAKSKTDQEQAEDEKDDVEKKEFVSKDFGPVEGETIESVKKTEKFLNTNADNAEKAVNIILKKINEDYIDQIRDKNLLTKFKPETIDTLKPKHLRELNTALKTYYSSLFKETYNMTQADWFPNEKRKFSVPLLPEEFLKLLNEESFKDIGDYAGDLSKLGKQIVIDSMKSGLGVEATLKLLRSELKNKSSRWAETVVRTKTNEIYNTARTTYYETDYYAKQMLGAYRWSSVLDFRTSQYCNEMHNKIITVEESQTLRPPAHLNCRSSLVAITKIQKPKITPKDELPNVLKENGKLVPGAGMVANRKGIVPKKTPRKKQPKKFELDDKPTLKNANMINLFGETVIVASPGVGKHINILSILASNINLDNPVIVGFRGSDDSELKYRTLLNFGGGLLQKEFTEIPWILDEDSALMIDMSAPVEIEYTIEYIITDIDGKRIM